MLQFLTDENFNGHITAGVLRREPRIDIISVEDLGMRRSSDPDILDWAAAHRRIVLSHDKRTMIGHAYARVKAGKPMAGLVSVRETVGIGLAVEEILLIAVAMTPEEMESQIIHVPMT